MRRGLIVLLLVLLAFPAFSITQIIPYSNTEFGSLNAVIAPASAQPEERNADVQVEAEITLAPGAGPLELLVAEKSDRGWKVVRTIGTLNGTSRVYFDLQVEYAGKSSEVRQYALIGRTSDEEGGEVLVKEFPLVLDWTAYTQGVREAITNANVLLVPLVSIGAVVLILALFELAFVHRKNGCAVQPQGGASTSMFFPAAERTTTGDVLAEIFINPAFMLFELAGAGIFAMLILSYAVSSFGNQMGMRLFVLTGIGALIVPVLYAAIAWLADIYSRRPLRIMLACFIWGCFAAVLAFSFNSLIALLFKAQLSGGDSSLLAAAVVLGSAVMSPTIEEVVKGLGLLVLVKHRSFRGILDGLTYGFVMGMGFAFLENWFYFVGRANLFEPAIAGWADFLTYRLLFNSLAHGAFTASCGAFIGYFKSREYLERFAQLAFIPGIMLAVALHALFNVSAILDEIVIYAVRIPVFVFNPIMVAVLAVALMLVYYFAMIDERKKIYFGAMKAVDEESEA
ncbi:MAG: PrsW family intramembrane metalloprotease [Candidatus Burarchaeum sp.]|nr:PrsW family intramembrane metalloprotease [Candidatus Burarchaeum sp.]MDO8339267.1 PrsW family intramembrane metalloprotease [Candidatus Burarchaeum sp.]